MSDYRIIFKQENGSVGIVIPTPYYSGTLEDLAQRTVPTGAPFQILHISQLPDDTFTDAWEWVE